MFDNVNWNKIINNTLSYIKEDWEVLTIKSVFSKISYNMKFYYSMDGDSFTDLYNEIDDDDISPLVDNMIVELKKITERFASTEEKMFLTIEAEKTGNVKVIYRDVKEGNKLPYDEDSKYLRLNKA